MQSYIDQMREAVNCKGIIIGKIEVWARNPLEKKNYSFGVNKMTYCGNNCTAYEFGVVGFNILKGDCR
jgi:hypothetical protein